MNAGRGVMVLALALGAAGLGYDAGLRHRGPAPVAIGGGVRFTAETVAGSNIAALGAFVDGKTGCEYLVVATPAGAAVTPLISAGGWYQGCEDVDQLERAPD